MSLGAIFLIAALVVFIIATWGLATRFNLVAAGLALLVLSMMFSGKTHAAEVRNHKQATHHHVSHPKSCRQWRIEVRHHPRLILPRRCHRA